MAALECRADAAEITRSIWGRVVFRFRLGRDHAKSASAPTTPGTLIVMMRIAAADGEPDNPCLVPNGKSVNCSNFRVPTKALT